jgi:formiminotetrahydrofolate cyclodeaminase
MYCNKSLKTYLDDLAAKKPAPGGGSAAALVGALGCALLSMVCNFTIGKDKYKDIEREIRKILSQTERLRKRFLSLVDLDVEAYAQVLKSHKPAGSGLPSDRQSHKPAGSGLPSDRQSHKGSHAIYQKNLIRATRVPLEVCSLSAAAYKLCPYLREKANKYLASDVYAARELLKSSLKSGEFNVIINLFHIKDKKFISQTKRIIRNLKKSL